MFRRLFRSTIVLAAILGAYQAYVTFAVPRMEPPFEVRSQRRASQVELEQGAKAVTKYQLLLANYFPKDHWTQVRPPKIFANGTDGAMLIIDEYTRHAETGDENNKSTQVDIKRFAMLMFPTPPHADVAAPRDAIVLEAQQGARLIFDDFHPEMGRIGQITRGEFPGPIVIRSDMREPGPDDDLLVETSDLQMNTKLLYTANPVRFRMAQNYGGGRELEIRFMADEHVQPKDQGLKIAGFDSLEIRRDVRMRMEVNTDSLLPGGKKSEPSPNPVRLGSPQASLQGRRNAGANPSVQVNDPSSHAAPKPPVEITCNGPFTFDFVRYVASVDRDVLVRQLNTDGPSNQLTCNQLDIHFAPKAPPDGKTEPVITDPGKAQHRDLGRLEAVAIVAQGHPAIAVAPAKQVEARGERIQIGIREQRVRLQGGNDTKLTSGTNVLQAPLIDYQKPPADAVSPIGKFRATGPGSLHFVPDPKKPDQVFQAAWQTSVLLNREEGQPVIVMEGRSEVALGSAGSLIADQIRLYLRELDENATAGWTIAGNGGQKPTHVAPDRIIAIGNVEIASPQVKARTQKFLANFRIVLPQSVAPGAPAVAATQQPVQPKSEPNKNPPQSTYLVVSDEIRLDAVLQGQTPTPMTLMCVGNVAMREATQASSEQQQPLEVRGAQLTVEHLDTKTPHVILKGAAIAKTGGTLVSTGGPQLAQVAGRGITLVTDAFEMDGKNNNMWSNGPGEATLTMSRGLQGKATSTPTSVKINWKGGLKFDGQTITFDRDVVVTDADSRLNCDRMLARMKAPIQFGQKIDQSTTNVSQIDCEGLVTIENVSRDLNGVTSHDRMELGRLTINQDTGAIYGAGPGIIRSTRFGQNAGPFAGPLGTQPQAATAASTNSSKLHFLRVDFHTNLDGNMYTHELTFHDRVRTVYGPVDSWEQELDLTRPESLPPEAMTLTCDALRLNEDPLAARSAAPPTKNPNPSAPTALGGLKMEAIQMQAKGDVRIQGQTPSQGPFRIQADRASYEKSKELFILEGDTRTPARLWRRTQAGADAPPIEARKISFNRLTNQAKVEGVQSLEILPSDVEKYRAKSQPGTTR
jgi:hypothetical protein